MNLSNFARRIFGKSIDTTGVRIRNTTPNIGKFHAERSRVFHASRTLLEVPEALQRLGFPARVPSKGTTYRKEKV